MPWGGSYGIHFPNRQESPRHLILAKFGDYDSKTIVITDKGDVFYPGGGIFRIFKHRYLVSLGSPADTPYAVTIFDLAENRILFRLSQADFIKPDENPTKETDLKSNQQDKDIKIYTDGQMLFAGVDIVEHDTDKTIGHTGEFYRFDLEAGKLTKAMFDNARHTEFVIDPSNLRGDNCECERIK